MASTTNGTFDKKLSNISLNVDACPRAFAEIKIPVPWGHICGKWWGSRERQPILAIHGWQDNAGTFDNLAPLLVKQEISILCIDLPGHGYSSHLPSGVFYYLFWDGMITIRRIVKHFNWSKVSILGHSLGGTIGFLYASTFPEQTDKYIALDIASPALRSIKSMCDAQADIVDNFLKYETFSKKNTPTFEYDEMIDIVHNAYYGSVNRDSCEIMMRRGMQPDGNGTYTFNRDPRLKVGGLGMLDIEQVMEMASRITCKVMNIRCTPGMPLENPEYYDQVLDVIEQKAKKFEKHLVPGMHHLHLNNAQSISDLIINFLKT